MEISLLSFPTIPTLFLLLFTALILRTKSKISNQIVPPGPPKLPILGSIHHLAGSLPHQRLRDLAKKYGDLMHLQLGEVSTIVVSSPETAKQIMQTHDVTFAQRPNLLAATILTYDQRDVAFSPYGAYWRQLKKICILELLSAKRVQSFRSIREEEVSKMIESISAKAGEVINLSEMIFALTNIILCRAAFGEKCKDQREIISAFEEVVEVFGGFSVADLYPSLRWVHVLSGKRPKIGRLHKRFDMMLEAIIGAHKASTARKKKRAGEPEEDLIDVLLRIQEQSALDFPLTNEDIKAVATDVFLAGSETSSTTVQWAIAEMLKQPTILKKAQAEAREIFAKKDMVTEESIAELNYLKLVIKETLRLHPPLPLLLPRECQENCHIKGYDVPAKSRVIVNAWAIGRDPNYWSEADKFIPERFLESSIDYKGTNFEYVPFGAGRRICPGINFGMANVILPLAQMLYRFDWELPHGAKGEDLDMDEAFGAVVRRKRDLYVIPIAHHAVGVK